MRYILALLTLLSVTTLSATTTNLESDNNSVTSVTTEFVPEPMVMPQQEEQLLKENRSLIISVIGQGVAPMKSASPAQAFAMAKRAATADAYRLIAEKVKGVRVDGQDLIKNMMVKRSTVRTSVIAMVRHSNIVETTFKDGLCEVEMEIEISHSQFH